MSKKSSKNLEPGLSNVVQISVLEMQINAYLIKTTENVPDEPAESLLVCFPIQWL